MSRFLQWREEGTTNWIYTEAGILGMFERKDYEILILFRGGSEKLSMFVTGT